MGAELGEQIRAGLRQGWSRCQIAKQVRECDRSEEGHTHCLQRPGAMDRVEWDDVRVLQLSQSLRFAADVRCDFQGNQAIRQAGLARQENPAKRPTAQLFHKIKVEESLAGGR